MTDQTVRRLQELEAGYVDEAVAEDRVDPVSEPVAYPDAAVRVPA